MIATHFTLGTSLNCRAPVTSLGSKIRKLSCLLLTRVCRFQLGCVSLLLYVGLASAQSLVLQTPCFDVNVAVPLETVLEVRLFHEGELVTVIDRGGFANEIRASACGIGDWIVESRTGIECIEIDGLGQRRATGEPCVWDDWGETLTATVTAKRPGTAEFIVVKNIVYENSHVEEMEQ